MGIISHRLWCHILVVCPQSAVLNPLCFLFLDLRFLSSFVVFEQRDKLTPRQSASSYFQFDSEFDLCYMFVYLVQDPVLQHLLCWSTIFYAGGHLRNLLQRNNNLKVISFCYFYIYKHLWSNATIQLLLLLLSMWWPCWILRPVAARKSAVRCSSAACPHSLVPTLVSSGQNCWRTVSRCGQVWRMCSGVCSSEPHSQWAESANYSAYAGFFLAAWEVWIFSTKFDLVKKTTTNKQTMFILCSSFALNLCFFAFVLLLPHQYILLYCCESVFLCSCVAVNLSIYSLILIVILIYARPMLCSCFKLANTGSVIVHSLWFFAFSFITCNLPLFALFLLRACSHRLLLDITFGSVCYCC